MNNDTIAHFDILGETPDMEDVIWLFSNLPVDQSGSIFLTTMERMCELAQEISTRQGLIDNFLKARDQMQELLSSGQYHIITTANSTNNPSTQLPLWQGCGR
jgi:hypothetical protein